MEKRSPKWQKFLSDMLHISVTIHHMIGIHMCEIIVSPDFCFIFLKFWLFGLLGGKKAKNSPKWQKSLFVTLHVWETIHHMIVFYDTHVWNNISRCFFSFSKFRFFGLLGSKSVKNGAKWPEILSVTFHISGTIYHVTVIYGMHL